MWYSALLHIDYHFSLLKRFSSHHLLIIALTSFSFLTPLFLCVFFNCKFPLCLPLKYYYHQSSHLCCWVGQKVYLVFPIDVMENQRNFLANQYCTWFLPLLWCPLQVINWVWVHLKCLIGTWSKPRYFPRLLNVQIGYSYTLKLEKPYLIKKKQSLWEEKLSKALEIVSPLTTSNKDCSQNSYFIPRRISDIHTTIKILRVAKVEILLIISCN